MQNAFKPSGERATASLEDYFRQSRLLLTAAYVLILLIILLSSGGLTRFFFYQRISDRFEHYDEIGEENPGRPMRPPSALEVRQDFVNTVIAVNGSLLLLAGLLSYWFAGSTLRPVQHAYEKQRRFLSDASHELRTPLAVLQLSLEHERDTSTDAITRKRAEENMEEVSRMRNLVQDLLIISQLHHTKTKNTSTEVVEVKNLVEETANRLRLLAAQHHVNLKIENSANPIHILAPNKEMIARALTNIIQNAILYNKEKGEVHITLEETERKARITVEDTGIGMSPEELKQVFERFYRSDKSRTRKTGGSGLGLSIVESIMETAGGHISMTSEPQKGTKVTLSFPIHNPS